MQWINDRIINFCFRFYENTCPGLPHKVLLLDPAVVSFMRHQCSDVCDFSDMSMSLELEDRELILLPITDSMGFESSSSHWSLVVMHPRSRRAIHLDSCSGHNLRAARDTVLKLEKLYRYLLFNIYVTYFCMIYSYFPVWTQG